MRFLMATILVAAVTILGTSMFATTAASTTAAPGTLSFIWEGEPPKYCLNRFDEYREGSPCIPLGKEKDSKDSEIKDAAGCFDCRYTDSKVTSHDYCESVDDYSDNNNYPIVWTDASCKCDYTNDNAPDNWPEDCFLNTWPDGDRSFQCKCDNGACDHGSIKNMCPDLDCCE